MISTLDIKAIQTNARLIRNGFKDFQTRESVTCPACGRVGRCDVAIEDLVALGGPTVTCQDLKCRHKFQMDIR